jgi:hypothetical protein
MPKAYFMVRAVVEEPRRQKFDHWYSTVHLPDAMTAFKAEKAWRFWSTLDAGVHYAVYQFADRAKLDAGVSKDNLQPLIADFDRDWPSGVIRSRDLVEMAEERSA